MAQDSKMGLGDKLKQKLHLGTSTTTSSNKSSNQSSSSYSTIMGNAAGQMSGVAPLATATPAPIPTGIQYEGPSAPGVHDVGGSDGQLGQHTGTPENISGQLGATGGQLNRNIIPENNSEHESAGQRQDLFKPKGTSDNTFATPGHQVTTGGVTGENPAAAQPKTPEKEPPEAQHPVSPELSSQLASSANAPGGPSGCSPPPGSASTAKDDLTTKPHGVGNTGLAGASNPDYGSGQTKGSPLDTAGGSEGFEGRPAHHAAKGTGTESAPQGVIAQAQEMVQPLVDKVVATSQPLVEKVRAAGSVVAERAQPAVQQVRESSQPLLGSAADTAQRIGAVGKQKASEIYNAAAGELDRQGVNRDTTKQKMADLGQAMKDYSVVGQERAGEYLQQAVDKACAIGNDGDNQNIFLKVLGTIALIWLAFGFSLTALVALGIAATIAALLSRYTRSSVGPQRTQPTVHDLSAPDLASRNERGGLGPGAPATTPSIINQQKMAHAHEA